MGCGVSKFSIEEDGAASPCHQLCPVQRRNDRAVVDISLLSKPLPEGGEGEDHAKGDAQHKNIKKVDSEACDKEASDEYGNDKDYSVEYPQSLSFRVYCVPSLSDDNNIEGHGSAGKTKDNQQRDVQNNKKGSSNRLRRRGRIGKGVKTGSAKVKSILRV